MTNTTLINDTRLRDLDTLMRKLGGDSVKSEEARGKFGMALAEAAADKVIDEDAVADRYDNYLKGRAAAVGKNSFGANVADQPTGNGRTANISKARQIVRMSMLPAIDGPATLRRVEAARVELLKGGDVKPRSAYDAFVEVSRAQIASPDLPLTDDEVAACARRPESKEKDELDKLIAAYKQVSKLIEVCIGNEVQPHIVTAQEELADAITASGGKVPPLTKEDKAIAAFMAQAEKLGMKIAAE